MRNFLNFVGNLSGFVGGILVAVGLFLAVIFLAPVIVGGLCSLAYDYLIQPNFAGAPDIPFLAWVGGSFIILLLTGNVRVSRRE